MSTKDPAFLFYSNNFYEGTRFMLPEERACYIDLLIYQHQHKYIPNDLRRLCLYCTGVVEATIQHVLETKFVLTDKGWFNAKQQKIMEDRELFSDKQSINGAVGQFWKKAKAILDAKHYLLLKDTFSGVGNPNVIEMIKDKEITKEFLESIIKPIEKINGSLKIDFELFWNLYDKKVGKDKAELKWAKLTLADQQKIMQHVPKYKVAQPDKKYRKNPETYFNNKSWNDELIQNNTHTNGTSKTNGQNFNASKLNEFYEAVDKGSGL